MFCSKRLCMTRKGRKCPRWVWKLTNLCRLKFAKVLLYRELAVSITCSVRREVYTFLGRLMFGTDIWVGILDQRNFFLLAEKMHFGKKNNNNNFLVFLCVCVFPLQSHIFPDQRSDHVVIMFLHM